MSENRVYVDGEWYSAADGLYCYDCAFREKFDVCQAMTCASTVRSDKRDVIWVPGCSESPDAACPESTEQKWEHKVISNNHNAFLASRIVDALNNGWEVLTMVGTESCILRKKSTR